MSALVDPHGWSIGSIFRRNAPRVRPGTRQERIGQRLRLGLRLIIRSAEAVLNLRRNVQGTLSMRRRFGTRNSLCIRCQRNLRIGLDARESRLRLIVDIESRHSVPKRVRPSFPSRGSITLAAAALLFHLLGFPARF